jgi:hypothetical protein
MYATYSWFICQGPWFPWHSSQIVFTSLNDDCLGQDRRREPKLVMRILNMSENFSTMSMNETATVSQLVLDPRETQQQWECGLRLLRNCSDHRYECFAHPDSILLHFGVCQFRQCNHHAAFLKSFRSLWRVAWNVLVDTSWAWHSLASHIPLWRGYQRWKLCIKISLIHHNYCFPLLFLLVIAYISL